MKNLCIIPARGGSKRVPRKNIRLLDGSPLISYSIRAAKDSGQFDKIILSSDDNEILQLGLSEGISIDERPPEMAGDHVTKVQVIHEFLTRNNSISEFDNIAALLPTCPFRTSKDVSIAVGLLEKNIEKEFLIGVKEYDFPIQLALEKKNDQLVSMIFLDSYKTTRSQDIKKRFHPNGAIYIATIDAFLREGTFFNKNMLAYEMSAIASFDIDYPYQFEIAEILAKKIKNKEITL